MTKEDGTIYMKSLNDGEEFELDDHVVGLSIIAFAAAKGQMVSFLLEDCTNLLGRSIGVNFKR